MFPCVFVTLFMRSFFLQPKKPHASCPCWSFSGTFTLRNCSCLHDIVYVQRQFCAFKSSVTRRGTFNCCLYLFIPKGAVVRRFLSTFKYDTVKLRGSFKNKFSEWSRMLKYHKLLTHTTDTISDTNLLSFSILMEHQKCPSLIKLTFYLNYKNKHFVIALFRDVMINCWIFDIFKFFEIYKCSCLRVKVRSKLHILTPTHLNQYFSS